MDKNTNKKRETKKRLLDRLVIAQNYHIKCHDCGQVLTKDRWVEKNHRWKKHGLCKDCFAMYDSPEY